MRFRCATILAFLCGFATAATAFECPKLAEATQLDDGTYSIYAAIPNIFWQQSNCVTYHQTTVNGSQTFTWEFLNTM